MYALQHSSSVPKLRHASSLARLSNLPNESALADDEEGPPPIPKKSRARQSSSPIDSYFPPVVTTGHSSSASFSGTSQSATIANGRPRTNTSASASQPRGTLSKKNSSSSLGYHGHLKAVRAAAEASAASYDRIHGTQTPPDAFRENKVEKEEEPDRSQATSAPKVSTGRGADSARILASFGKKGGTGPVPQTLLDALTKLESDRAVRSPNLFATKQASSVWGVATPESESTDDDLPLPSLPWMSSADPRPRSSSSSRRVASEGSAPGDTWRPSDQAPQDPESSMKEAAVVDTPLAEPGASEKEPTSPRATRIPLSARLAKAVNSNSISRPTSPEVSRPSSPAQGRNHRRSLSAAQEEALVAKSQHAYALQLSNMLFPMAPEAIDQDTPETEKVSSTPASPSLNGLSSPKRSSVLLSKSLVH